jgi:predicted Fe-S protein YdhL (DUF1289 family)
VSDDVASPCVRVCVIDPQTGFCRGCGRTLVEIAAWPTLEPPARRRILEALDARRRG